MKRVKISESQLKRLVELNITNNAPNIGMGGKSSGKKILLSDNQINGLIIYV